jgi:hypothetical protein
LATSTAPLPPSAKCVADDDLHLEVRQPLLQQLHLGVGVLGAVVDGHHALEPILVAHVVDVALEIDQALLERGQVLLADVGHVHAAVVLERADRRDDDRAGRREPGLAALDVDELLRAEVGAEAGLGDRRSRPA